MRVLVIDDEIEVLEAIKQNFQAMGNLEVACAQNGMAGLQLFREQAFDIVICDVRMPGIDGLRVAREINQHTAKCSVILMTGSFGISHAVKGRTGIFSLIEKPFDLAKLNDVFFEAAKSHGHQLNVQYPRVA
jgi:DNA-binding NtrC family response regulator